MKIFVGAILVTGLLMFFRYSNFETQQKVTTEITKTITFDAPDKIKIATDTAAVNLLKQNEKMQQENWNKQKIQLYIKSKPTKECMRILKTTELNNEVAECNKNHYVELRNEEVEQYKIDHELNLR